MTHCKLQLNGRINRVDHRPRSGRITGNSEIWERTEAEAQPRILPPRYASRQDDSARDRYGLVAVAEWRDMSFCLSSLQIRQIQLIEEPAGNLFQLRR
jgi:hypothetical protein